MKKKFQNMSPLTNSLNNMIIDLPSPTSISYMWNWGSLLAFTMMIQTITGIFLASHYLSEINSAFYSIIHILRDVDSGWMIRNIHMNGASMFFILIFTHIKRGMKFSSYKMNEVWYSGTIILLTLMATAFLGYVLPWGQMSFWGATVITNLMSAIPFIGSDIVQWLWGGFSINQATLSRFFTLHFLLPFIILAMVMIHLIFLHQTGSSMPLGLNSNLDKMPLHPYFSMKDVMGALMFLMLMMTMSFMYPLMMGDPENFNLANPLNTPIHIQPEWYFLFAYAILRSIPNKLGGVIALLMSILIILMLSSMKTMKKSKKFSPAMKMLTWTFISIFIILTWVGANPVEAPFEMIGKMMSMFYFINILMVCFLTLSWKQ